MHPEIGRTMRRSARDFAEIAWPLISETCGGGELRTIEAHTTVELAKELDMLGGIDAWQVAGGGYIRGIASRVQWVPSVADSFDTFTIRRSTAHGNATEWQKRRAAVRGDVLAAYPQLTVQAYVTCPNGGNAGQHTTCGVQDHGPACKVAVVRTRHLIEYMDRNIERLERSQVRPSGTGETFYYVRWRELPRIFITQRLAVPSLVG